MSAPKIETVAVHAGQPVTGDPATGARAIPIYQTSSYLFRDTEHAANLFSLKEMGNIYTRLNNPTNDILEQRMAAIEGGTAALAVSSGMAAIFYTILNLTDIGDEIVAGNNLYGGTYQLFSNSMPKLGRKFIFVDSTDPKAYKAAITDKTKALYAETIGNPKLDVPDFEALAKIAHDAGIPLIVDNTLGIGLVRPIEYGADILATSTTKYVDGHGTSLGGVIVDSGNFNWGNGKFPAFTTPDPSYHGVKYWEAFGDFPGIGNCAFVFKIRLTWMRDTGAVISPFNAFLQATHAESLVLRQQRHSANALELARWLWEHPLVSFVNYPGLEEHPSHATAKKYLKGHYGGMLGFGVKGGFAASKKFINSVKMLSHVTNIGDTKTLVTHPASTTHQQLTEEAQRSVGVTPDFIRLSVGIENIRDIKADIDQALKASQE